MIGCAKSLAMTIYAINGRATANAIVTSSSASVTNCTIMRRRLAPMLRIMPISPLRALVRIQNVLTMPRKAQNTAKNERNNWKYWPFLSPSTITSTSSPYGLSSEQLYAPACSLPAIFSLNSFTNLSLSTPSFSLSRNLEGILSSLR